MLLQALAEKRIGRRDQANAWIWRLAEYTREVHEEYAVQRWPETKRLLGLLVNSSGGAHARNARRLVHAARKQDRRLSAALLAAALAHTPEAEEVLRGARTRMARKPSALARELLRNFPKGRRGRRRRRKNADKKAPEAAAATKATNGAAAAETDDAAEAERRRRRRRCGRERRQRRRRGDRARRRRAQRRPLGRGRGGRPVRRAAGAGRGRPRGLLGGRVGVPSGSTLAVFALASFLLIIVPGPAVLYVVTRSIAQGRRAGIVSMLGVETGGLVHVAAAAIGLSALVASSAAAFTVVKFAGAAYLIFLGVRRLVSRDEALPEVKVSGRSDRQLFAQGVVVNVLNPKTAVFFLAFLPQFVDPARGTVTLQFLVLGLVFVAVAVLSDGAYALVAGTAGDWLRGSEHVRRSLSRFSGAVFLGLGVTAAHERPA